ncbi:hypothetical protein VSVS05_01452 [Vibrio scophthalmi]|uniref:Uncharacterized protein n=1 Tax=Vibrio scophthalmi TaxID=45658 RepID=A0A1C7FA04_9VIBR|nr:hypothetical protein VSVS05_01452 [Vibrio scophthalmi]
MTNDIEIFNLTTVVISDCALSTSPGSCPLRQDPVSRSCLATRNDQCQSNIQSNHRHHPRFCSKYKSGTLAPKGKIPYHARASLHGMTNDREIFNLTTVVISDCALSTSPEPCPLRQDPVSRSCLATRNDQCQSNIQSNHRHHPRLCSKYKSGTSPPKARSRITLVPRGTG